MLRACVLVLRDSWELYLPLWNLHIINSFQAIIGMVPCEALYGRRCRSLVHYDEVGEKRVLGPKIIERTVEVIDKIRTRIKAVKIRQKSYADTMRKDLEFEVGERVFLKVALIKDVLRFDKKGKLQPRYIKPFEILDRVVNVTYRLTLPLELSVVHYVFLISMIRKYRYDPDHMVNYQSLKVQKDLSYKELLIKILDRKVCLNGHLHVWHHLDNSLQAL
ncbi:uncharacterized protein LOC111384171 [Olea europaea var. sylvestris]|uniref:uncharacterized protein LOC111384171 n=1 Tax=Olea europaea var. sylvestris TaxID=158386 RepID=UPI000C1D1C3C|nr:uncharacterized protein LOC111384171 [Olea europaea var. sylvestris]